MAWLAATQWRQITTAQLRECGLSDRQIEGRVTRGGLWPSHRGVFSVGTPARTDRERFTAATLAAGGVLSHHSAAVLLGFAADRGGRPHVTRQAGASANRSTLVVHRATLDPRDISEVDGIPVTTGPRTLLERAAVLGERALDGELTRARARGLAPTEHVLDVIARHPRRAGGPALARAVLGPFTRSELERRLLDLLRANGITLPRCNVPLHGFEVDALWDDARLVVELDGKATHGVTAALARDAERDRRLREAGMEVWRLTWWDVVRDPGATACRLRTRLTRR